MLLSSPNPLAVRMMEPCGENSLTPSVELSKTNLNDGENYASKFMTCSILNPECTLKSVNSSLSNVTLAFVVH
jgi:hypothetical protein